MFDVTQAPTSPVVRPASPQKEAPTEESECLSICRDRFKYVILANVFFQYLLLVICSIALNMLQPRTWMKESSAILGFPIVLILWHILEAAHGYLKLKPLIVEKFYHPTRFSRFINSFGHEASVLSLNFSLGLVTSLLFMRYFREDFSTFILRTGEKRFLNERFAYLAFHGAFIRCYLYLKRRDADVCISFPLIHQSNLLQLRRQILTVLRSAFVKSMLPTFHFFAFYNIFGSVFSYSLGQVFNLHSQQQSLVESLSIFLDIRLIIYSWILSSLIWSNMELASFSANLFVSKQKEFPIEGNNQLNLPQALSVTKFQIIQQLAAQDLYNLSESPSNIRRKQFYALSNPGGHPHNWKLLVQKSLEIINKFSDDMKQGFETQTPAVGNNLINNSFYKFHESKRIVREYNEFSGIRNLTTTSIKYEPAPVKKQLDVITTFQKKLQSNRFIFFLFGEEDFAKLKFHLSKNTQTLVWILQGTSALIARSLQEDSYGVVQLDISKVVKSILKLKTLLDRVGTVNTVAKDKNFLMLKAAVRRSLYRITVEFSSYFDDLLLEPEDIRSLQAFVLFREL